LQERMSRNKTLVKDDRGLFSGKQGRNTKIVAGSARIDDDIPENSKYITKRRLNRHLKH
jgi:hypothetical protein